MALIQVRDLVKEFDGQTVLSNINLDLNKQVSFGQKCVLGLLRALLAPYADNEAAANFLRTEMGQADSTISNNANRKVAEYAR